MDAPRLAAWTLAVLMLLAASLGAAAPPAWARGGVELECGALAPILNSCTDCCAALTADPEMNVNGLGFEGRLHVALVAAWGSVWWDCEVLLVDPLLETCSGPVRSGNVTAGEQVSLACQARPAQLAGILLGPAGPWTCAVDGLA